MQLDRIADHSAYLAALHAAQSRAPFSYYDQHVLRDEERGYVAIDEQDYAWLTEEMIERIVLTIPGTLTDEY